MESIVTLQKWLWKLQLDYNDDEDKTVHTVWYKETLKREELDYSLYPRRGAFLHFWWTRKFFEIFDRNIDLFYFIFDGQETVFEIFDRNIYHRRHKTGLRLPDDSV